VHHKSGKKTSKNWNQIKSFFKGVALMIVFSVCSLPTLLPMHMLILHACIGTLRRSCFSVTCICMSGYTWFSFSPLLHMHTFLGSHVV
jgi:hypothetical protein